MDPEPGGELTDALRPGVAADHQSESQEIGRRGHRVVAELAAAARGIAGDEPGIARINASLAADFRTSIETALACAATGRLRGSDDDLYARLLARFLGAHIPGHPAVIVQNMEGAGGVRAANHVYSAAPKDGTAFGIFDRGLPMERLLGRTEGQQFDATKFTWIGSTNAEPSLCVSWNESKILTLEDMKERPFTVAATGINANSGLVPTILNRVLGTKIKGGNKAYGANIKHIGQTLESMHGIAPFRF